MKNIILLLSLLILGSFVAKCFAAESNIIDPSSMTENVVAKASMGNGIALVQMFFKDVNGIDFVSIEHANNNNGSFSFIKKVWGVDIAHTQNNRFIIMDTELSDLSIATQYRITLHMQDGSEQVFYTELAAQ